MAKPDPFAIDDDNPALTQQQLGSLKSAADVFTPEQLVALAGRRRPGRPLKEDRKVEIKLRVSPDVLAAFKAGGAGWQTRMHEVLERAAKAEA